MSVNSAWRRPAGRLAVTLATLVVGLGTALTAPAVAKGAAPAHSLPESVLLGLDELPDVPGVRWEKGDILGEEWGASDPIPCWSVEGEALWKPAGLVDGFTGSSYGYLDADDYTDYHVANRVDVFEDEQSAEAVMSLYRDRIDTCDGRIVLYSQDLYYVQQGIHLVETDSGTDVWGQNYDTAYGNPAPDPAASRFHEEFFMVRKDNVISFVYLDDGGLSPTPPHPEYSLEKTVEAARAHLDELS